MQVVFLALQFLLFFIIGCTQREAPLQYPSTVTLMNELSKRAAEYQSICGVPAVSLEQLQVAFKNGTCPNSDKLTKIDVLPETDKWDNPIFLVNSKGGQKFVSCGAEWLEVPISSKSISFIDAYVEKGKLIINR